MFQEHPNLSLPELSTILWRYLDLPKLVSLLEHQSLWFARLDTLGDPYEGVPPKPLIDDMWRIADDLPETERLHRTDVASHNTRFFSTTRNLVFVSCWHANPVESAAMWSLYARLGEGIAIRTTFDRFRRSFTVDSPVVYAGVYGGMVRYVDFDSYRPTSFNLFEWATLKRASFAHELEFRGVVMASDQQEGLAVPVDVNTLASEVYVAPAAMRWYADLVRRICARYGLKADVRQSDLLSRPAYLLSHSNQNGPA